MSTKRLKLIKAINDRRHVILPETVIITALEHYVQHSRCFDGEEAKHAVVKSVAQSIIKATK